MYGQQFEPFSVWPHESPEGWEWIFTRIAGISGRFILSGYDNPLYTGFAARHGWRRVDIEIDNKAGGGKEKRKMIECLWMNY